MSSANTEMRFLKLAAMLLVVLAASATSTRDDFPTLGDQILWKSEQIVCRDDPMECVGLSHMMIRCCRIRIGLI